MAAALPISMSAPDQIATPRPKPPERRRVSPWADSLFALLAHGAAWLTLLLPSLLPLLVTLPDTTDTAPWRCFRKIQAPPAIDATSTPATIQRPGRRPDR